MPRLRYGAVLRALVILALICLWIQIMLSAQSGSQERDGDDVMSANETSLQVLAAVPQGLRKYLTMRSQNYTMFSAVNTTDQALRWRNASDILREIQRYNDAQTVLNEDIFGPVQNDTVIIAVQVHTRLTYLRHLVVSLAQARGIENALLIFSHDYFEPEINYLVQSIDFCRVMQIFYPYSIQTHPDEFPGMDPNDCPKNAKKLAKGMPKCNNAAWPDVHGYYREAKYTQIKHHWWWKANRIFNQLRVTRNHIGMVLFLEEDHYVAADILHVLGLMHGTAQRICPQCEIFCLGTYLKTYSYHRAVNKVEITPWQSSKHNMGMAFNRTVFRSIVNSSEQFCRYDDYNWDFSLLHLSQNRPGRDKFRVMLSVGPRVFHIGECGIHHKKSDCNASTVISKVQKLLRTANGDLFPGSLTAQLTSGGSKANKRLVKGNGGWGDRRDQDLCMNMTRMGRQWRKYGLSKMQTVSTKTHSLAIL